ncbi:uncharacterized protein UBRO_00441 [Ustilago bromivora]|uniref:Homeobox domain-containing protein n=1 Tax=Ustilago bromivora TaxID=307758 RepID=A0A1K0H155_9BASI|nr:uncharacterized protein UBRO_00441 [Ustilago bromivora]SYW81084.1 uncharacterized protein UBRO2_04116 [Ustilago bromivora]
MTGEEKCTPPSLHAAASSSHRLDMSSQHRGSSQSDGRDAAPLETPPQQHLHPRSSPTAASVESFSSYINKDAALFQNRSSSPRAEDRSDPASHTASPRHIVTTPVISRDAFRHQHWTDHDHHLPPRPSNGLISIEHLHSTNTTTQLPPPSHASYAPPNNAQCDDREQVEVSESNKLQAQPIPASQSPAIDVNRLSVSNLAQKNQEDDAVDPSYRNAQMRAAASMIGDDSFESTTSVLGEDAKNEIRRRRRTRPDEANLLAEVYTKNPFPDHEARLFLANRLGMSVRAVSVWFQNRRQAEKKRSNRYGGSGIAPGATPAPEESPARPSAAAPAPASAPVPAPVQRKPLGNASANAAAPTKTFDPSVLKDLSQNNKENIPPWLLAGRETTEASPLKRSFEKIKRDVPLAASLTKQQEAIARDLRQAVGPEGVGITAHRVEVDTVPVPIQAAASSSKSSALSRHSSVPRLSLDDVLSGRSNTLRRSATDHNAPLTKPASSEIEQEQLDTILPPPKLLSRASSSSSLSLLTTSGGRASLGNFELRKEASPAPQPKQGTASASLTSSLPPKLTVALQRQGIIGMQPTKDTLSVVQGKGLLQMMPSSSASSSDADYPPHIARQDSEEDEERTLKLIAQRRAAKAQASALAKAQAAREKAAASSVDTRVIVPMDPGCADARQAIQTQAGFCNSSLIGHGSLGSISTKSGATVVGLPSARQLSLDWAAGRDRASTSALPISIGGTPLSRSVSARQLSLQRMPSESTPPRKQQQQQQQLGRSAPTNGEKSKAATGRRSLSATDLTRRLQEAKRKDDAVKPTTTGGRKRPASAIQVTDENRPPPSSAAAKKIATAAPAPKRRKAQLEDVATSFSVPETRPASFGSGMPTPMLSSRPFTHHSSFLSSTTRPMGPTMIVPSTPSSNTPAFTIPLSTRSDRFRAVGTSPATTITLGRSISANYPRHPSLPSRQTNRPWESSHTRTYSGEESWTPRSTHPLGSGMESLSQPLPSLTASTPSRVLGDRSNFGSCTPLISRETGERFGHDDSGFFEAFSDDEEENRRGEVLVKGKKVVSPRKASLRSIARPVAEGDDHQAAELLLGLGKTVGSRDSSSSQ